MVKPHSTGQCQHVLEVTVGDVRNFEERLVLAEDDPVARIDELELEPEYPVHDNDVLFKYLPAAQVLVLGYLSLDSDPLNPMEEHDCMGKLEMTRDAISEAADLGTLEAIEEYEKDPERDPADEPCDWTPNPFAVLVSSSDYNVTQIHPYKCADLAEVADKFSAAGVWYPDEDHVESVKISAIAKLLELPQYRNGVKLPDAVSLRILERAELLDIAKSVLGEYNFYLSGEVFGRCVEVFNLNGERLDRWDSACWGFHGEDYARCELTQEFERVCAELIKDQAPLPLFEE